MGKIERFYEKLTGAELADLYHNTVKSRIQEDKSKLRLELDKISNSVTEGKWGDFSKRRQEITGQLRANMRALRKFESLSKDMQIEVLKEKLATDRLKSVGAFLILVTAENDAEVVEWFDELLPEYFYSEQLEQEKDAEFIVHVKAIKTVKNMEIFSMPDDKRKRFDELENLLSSASSEERKIIFEEYSSMTPIIRKFCETIINIRKRKLEILKKAEKCVQILDKSYSIPQGTTPSMNAFGQIDADLLGIIKKQDPNVLDTNMPSIKDEVTK